MRILILDQNPDRAKQAVAALREHKVEAVRSPEEAAERLKGGDHFDLLAVTEGFPQKGIDGLPAPPPLLTLPDPGKGPPHAAMARQAVRVRTLEQEIWQLKQAVDARGRELLFQEKAREEHSAALAAILHGPVEAVRNWAERIAAGVGSQEAAAGAERILSELGRLQELSQAVHRLARVEVGRSVLERGFVPVHSILEGALKMLTVDINDAGVATEIQSGGELLVYADPAHLIPGLAELIREGLPGSKSLTLRGAEVGERLVIEVRPEGDTPAPETTSALGVGYQLACAAARDHGGDVIIEREPGGRPHYLLWIPRVDEREIPETWVREELNRAVQSGIPFTLIRVESTPRGPARIETVLKNTDRWIPLRGEGATLLLLPGLPAQALWSLASRVAPFFGTTSALPFRSLTYPSEVPSADAFLARAKAQGYLPRLDEE